MLSSGTGLPWEPTRTPSPGPSGGVGPFRSGLQQYTTRHQLRPTSLFPPQGLTSMVVNPSHQQTFLNTNPEETVYVQSDTIQQSNNCEHCKTLLEEFRSKLKNINKNNN